jgi:hypothetical protein
MEMESQGQNHPRRAFGQSWLAGVILIVLGAVFFLGQGRFFDVEALLAVVIVAGIGTTFFAVYLHDRKHWWALIPAYVLWVAAGGVFLGEFLNLDDLEGVYYTAAIGLAFLYVYVKNTDQWWALIPTYIMFVAAIGILLNDILFRRGDSLEVFLPLAFSLPFFYLYLKNHRHWWALIPGGILASVGVGFLIQQLVYIVPIALIAGGAFLILHKGNREESPEPVLTGPEADR